MIKIPPKVKFFTGQNLDVIEENVDEFIHDIEDIEVMDIKFCCDPNWFHVMVIYR